MLIAALLFAGAIAINMRFEFWDWKRARSRDELRYPTVSLRRRLIFEPVAMAVMAVLIMILGSRYVDRRDVAGAAAAAAISSALGAWRRYRRRKAVEYDL